MQGLNSTGRTVSLLSDEQQPSQVHCRTPSTASSTSSTSSFFPLPSRPTLVHNTGPYDRQHHQHYRPQPRDQHTLPPLSRAFPSSSSSWQLPSISPSCSIYTEPVDSPLPSTPSLIRSSSYDSETTADPSSPLSPTFSHHHAFQSSSPSTLTTPLDDPTSPLPSLSSSEQPKRYPCKYRLLHGCDKTFTTSGHASRHSKIHTAEKAVACVFPDCAKKFTRADNMKQHLETHYKERPRQSTGCPGTAVTQRQRRFKSQEDDTRTAGWLACVQKRSGLDTLAMAIQMADQMEVDV